MAQSNSVRLPGKCPSCHKAILDPFYRYCGATPYFHHAGKNRPACRLIVVIDPHGHDHHVLRVPHGTRAEAFLEEVLDRHGLARQRAA